jgi:hypothetical protein
MPDEWDDEHTIDLIIPWSAVLKTDRVLHERQIRDIAKITPVIGFADRPYLQVEFDGGFGTNWFAPSGLTAVRRNTEPGHRGREAVSAYTDCGGGVCTNVGECDTCREMRLTRIAAGFGIFPEDEDAEGEKL